jgi:hypothetical protein
MLKVLNNRNNIMIIKKIMKHTNYIKTKTQQPRIQNKEPPLKQNLTPHIQSKKKKTK